MWRDIKKLENFKPWELPGMKSDERLRKLILNDTGLWGQKPYSYVSLYMLALSVNAKVMVELGTGAGGGSTVLTAAARKTGGKVYTIDKQHPVESSNGSFVCDYLAPEVKDGLIELIHGETVETGKNWNKGKIDFIFMDANHDYYGVMQEFDAWHKHLKPNALIVVHDTIYLEKPSGIYKACLQYAANNNKNVYHLDTHAGMALITPRTL